MKTIYLVSKQFAYYSFPDDAPIDNIEALEEYVELHKEAQGDWAFFLNTSEDFYREIIKPA